MARDRRTSPAREDRRLTGDLINATMRYLNNNASVPDESFARVVLDGCTAKSGDYPPQGHDYPHKDR